MTETILWTSFNIPTNVRDRNLLLSDMKAHAARISHKRRRGAAKNASPKRRSSKNEIHVQIVNLDPDPVNLSTVHVQTSTGNEVVDNVFWSSGEDERAITQLLEDNTERQIHHHYPGQTAHQPQLTYVPDLLSAVFEHPYQRQSFDIWIREVSHHKVRYGFHYEELFSRIMPQLCMTSPALRHMILAQSLHYQQRKTSPTVIQTRPLASCSLYHYTKALEAMRQARLPNKELLAAICIASILETNQDNNSGSMRHVKGYKEMLQIYQGKYDEDYQAIRSCYSVIKVYNDLATLGKLPDDRTDPWSLETSREEMKKLLHSVVDCDSWKDPLDVFRMKVAFGQWFNRERDWNRIYDTSINREALLLLLPFAVSLMPEQEVGELSSVVEPGQVVYLISAAESVLERGRKLEDKERNQLFETLELLAFSTIKYVKDPKCLKAATNLLQKIMCQKRNTRGIKGLYMRPLTE